MRTLPGALAELRHLIDARGAALRRFSRDELVAVRGRPTEHIRIRGRRATISIIVEAKTDGSLRVVVQGFMRWCFMPLLSSVALHGFYKLLDGEVKPMPDKEFYEFD